MSQKSLFYNAFPDEDFATGYDRNYNGDDLSDWFSIVCETGVLKEGLAVTAAGSGLSVSVAVGKATIRGKGYINNTAHTLTLDTAPTGANPRYDLIVLRMDNTQTKSARRTYLTVVTGTSAVPTVSSLTRTADIYDLLLAYVAVQPNATDIEQTDITDTRGDQTLCPWFTAVKGYDDYYDAIVQQFESNITLASAGRVVTTDLATSLYNSKYSLVDVYCNGLKEENTDFTVVTTGGYIVINFTATKSAGAQISVVLSNFIDGEGMSTALAQYNEFVQDVADLKAANNYTYVCNGMNDNVNISNIVNAFIAGGTDYGSLKLNIVGNFGCLNGGSYPVTVGGEGTSTSPYQIFKFNSGNRRAILDFSRCSQVSVPISGVYCTIFAGQIAIEGLNLVTSGTTAGTTISVFRNVSGEDIRCTNCRFWVNGYQGSRIAYGGIFENCRGSISNVTGASYCFEPTSDILRVTGGEYIAYTGQSTAKSAVVGQSMANAVSILYGVNMPVIARSGFYQTNSILQYSGGGQVRATDLVTTLQDVIASGTIRNTIAINKPNSL